MSAATPNSWTIGSLLNWTEQFFRDRGLDSPRLDAQVLLAHALNCRRTDLYVRYEVEPTEEQRTRFREMVKARAAGKPVAYLVGRKEFFLLDLVVSPAVLIPRPATETLVMAALAVIKPLESPRVLDLGTGSGCVAVAIAANNKQAKVTATDISADAIAIARTNVERHGVSQQIQFAVGDLYSAIDANSKFDVIVSNPPYIPTGELAKLMTDVKDHEPISALDGGADGFSIIDQIIREAVQHLTPRGLLLIEVGVGQAETVSQKLTAAGFGDIKVQQDADGIPRVVSGIIR